MAEGSEGKEMTTVSRFRVRDVVGHAYLTARQKLAKVRVGRGGNSGGLMRGPAGLERRVWWWAVDANSARREFGSIGDG